MDDESDFESYLDNNIDYIYNDLIKRFNINIPKSFLSIIIDDVLYEGRNFHSLRYKMHNCVTFCLDTDVKLLDYLNNIILKQ